MRTSAPGISWGLLGALGIAALAASDAVVAEDNPVSVPEIRVIANTPLAPPSPRRAPRAAERPAPRAPEPEPTRGSTERTSRQAAAGPRSAAPSQAAAPAAPAVTDPALIERDKIPANVQTLSAGDFDHAKAPDLLDAISRGLPGVALDDQTGNEFQRDLNYRGFVASPVIGTPQGLAVYQNGGPCQRGLRRHRQLGLYSGDSVRRQR
jgi:iron complex outermembrane recepter protein